MKKFCILLISFFFTLSLCSGRHFPGNKFQIRTVSTKWFDIIYPEDSFQSALKLYENADSIYEDIAHSYGMEPQVRMPVILIPYIELYNAYWSSGFYNHIVLYDTAISDSMPVFSEDLLSTFRHEATHAFTYNMKDKRWSFLSKIFGETVSGCGLTLTPGISEGATLTSESSSGEGRLNSEYSKQMVRQAKIENNFPSFTEIQGEADCLPSGSFYYFNGAFNEYLQKNYGMEKYSKFWFLLVNGQYLTINTAFKKTYGLKLKNAWKDFYNSYYIPEVEAAPVENKIVQDFFDRSKNQYSKNNQAGSLYSSLSINEKGLYFLDEKTDTLYFVDNQNLRSNGIRPKKILTFANITEAKVSADNRFAAFSYYSINDVYIKTKSAVYDLESKKLLTLPGTGLKSVSIIKNKDEYYVTGLKFHSQQKQIDIYRIDLENNKIISCTKTTEIPLPENTNASCFSDLKNGTFAFLRRSKLNYSICIAELSGTLIKEYNFPQNKIEIRDLSYNSSKKEFIFSYATTDQMPQLGKIDTETDILYLWEKNLSGGIYNPVIKDEECYYLGCFYLQNRLLVKNEAEIEYTAIALTPSVPVLEQKPYSQDSLPYTKYKGSKYFFRGTLIPASLATSVSFDPYNYGSTELPFGLTYINRNPWDTHQLLLSAGSSLFFDSVGLEARFESTTLTSLFNYSLLTSLEFDTKGFKQTTQQISLGSGFYTGNHSTLLLNNTSTFHYGRATCKVKPKNNNSIPPANTNYIYGVNKTSATYSNTIKTGPGRYEKLGFSVSSILMYQYNASTGTNGELYKNGTDLGFSTIFYIPKLLPVKNKQGIVTNLPAKLGFNLFVTPVYEQELPVTIKYLNSKAEFPAFNLASTSFEMILFEKDIQKNIKFLPLLFASDFQVSLDYIAGVNTNKEIYSDNWRISKIGKYAKMVSDGTLNVVSVPYVKITFGVTPSFGQLASYDYKQLLCFKAGCIVDNGTITPIYSFALDLSF